MPLSSMEKLDDPVYSAASACFYLIEKHMPSDDIDALAAEQLLARIKGDLHKALRSAGILIGRELVDCLVSDKPI